MARVTKAQIEAACQSIMDDLAAYAEENLLGAPMPALAAGDRSMFSPQPGEKFVVDGIEMVVEHVLTTFDHEAGIVHNDIRMRPTSPMIQITMTLDEGVFDRPQFDPEGRWAGYVS